MALSAVNARSEYVVRINRVIDYVQAHWAEDPALSELARVAAFSPYHFHRVFRALVGETLGQFIARLRAKRLAPRLPTGAPKATAGWAHRRAIQAKRLATRARRSLTSSARLNPPPTNSYGGFTWLNRNSMHASRSKNYRSLLSPICDISGPTRGLRGVGRRNGGLAAGERLPACGRPMLRTLPQ
jgi:AraC-like DNA-binding protein